MRGGGRGKIEGRVRRPVRGRLSIYLALLWNIVERLLFIIKRLIFISFPSSPVRTNMIEAAIIFIYAFDSAYLHIL